MSMKKNYLLICFVALSLTKAYGFNSADSLYKVLKIKTIGNYYEIHAIRNDSLFKIVSEKVVSATPHLEMLKKGQYYTFDFGKEHGDTTTIEAKPLAGNASYLHVKRSPFWGNTKIKFTKRFHYRIYTSKNLIGLYYSPS